MAYVWGRAEWGMVVNETNKLKIWSVLPKLKHQTAANWLFFARGKHYKVAQFLSSNHMPNFPNLSAFQP